MIIIIIILIIILIATFKEGAQLAMAVFSGALKINNEIKIISHVIISKMLTVVIKNLRSTPLVCYKGFRKSPPSSI